MTHGNAVPAGLQGLPASPGHPALAASAGPALSSAWRLALLAIAAAVIALNFLLSERIPVNGGLGWDGQHYARVVMDPGTLLRDEISPYYVQRFLPGLAVHGLLRAAGDPLDASNVVWGFVVLNGLLLLLSVWLWLRVGDALGWSSPQRWFSGLALFANFAVLKQFFYYPVLTDVAAFTLGLAFFHAYVSGRRPLMLMLTVLGAFIWPVAAHVGLLLFLFGRTPRPGRSVDFPVITWLAAAGFAAFHGALIYYVHVIRQIAYVPVMEGLLPVSAALSVGYVFLATQALLGGMGLRELLQQIRSLNLGRLLVVALVAASLTLVVRELAGPHPSPAARGLLAFTGFYPVAKPLMAVVGAAVFLGPVWLVLLINWRAFGAGVRRESMGMALVLLLHVLISLVSEGRMLILAFPMIVCLLTSQLRGGWLRPAALGTFALLSLAWSKVWFTINVNGFPYTPGAEWAHPAQRYFMHHGPWMSDESYLWQGLLLLASAVALLVAARVGATTDTAELPPTAAEAGG